MTRHPMSEAERGEQAYQQLFGAFSEAGSDVSARSDSARSRSSGSGVKLYFKPRRGASYAQLSSSEQSHGDPEERGENMPHNEGGDAERAEYMDGIPDVHVRQMEGYEPRLLGARVQPSHPLFNHGCTMPGGWQEFRLAGLHPNKLVPVRAMCFNIPAECFSLDAHRFNEWQTPMSNSVRVASIAALIGLVSTPLSKGWLSGSHEEVERDVGHGDGAERGGDKKLPKKVHWHMMPAGEDGEQNVPMFITAYEELYNSLRDTVMAIRVWHFVMDPKHSTSYLARKLMEENSDELDHSGQSRCPNNLRRTSLVTSSQQTRALMGSSLEGAELELVAGMCYRHVIDLNEYKNLLTAYAGQTDKSPGLHPIPGMEDSLPQGLFNFKFEGQESLGCTHPLALEWVFNAKRSDALKAGLVHISSGEIMDIDPEQLNVASYFDLNDESGSPQFDVPHFVKEDKKCFFFQTIPFKQNIFDMSLPRAIAGSVSPGKELLTIFRERFAKDVPLDSPQLLNLFNSTMTGRDQWMEKQVKALADSITSFDSFSCSREQRKEAKAAREAASRGLVSYGQMDGEDHVVEPREVLKDHAHHTASVHSKLVQPWAHEQKSELEALEQKLRTGEENAEFGQLDGIAHHHFAELRKKKAQFSDKYNRIMEELCKLHLSKMERAFNSRMESESIPAGYRAVWKGLMKELESMPDGTANVAFALDMQMTDSDRTLFGHMQNWLGVFFEDDCFVDGRDWRLMQELFYHCFEQFGEQTLLLIFCGPKGNGKTLRTERAMKAFVQGWINMSGPSSAKSGMQGNSDSHNGSNCIYDEMIDELTDSDGSNRTEYWKMILMKREYVYNKPIIVKGADGREMHRTFKLKTPHRETHCVCTNRGPAFTKGQEDPSEVKSALIDRAVVQFVRTLGSKTHTDEEFDAHMSDPDVVKKTRAFRIITCLMGMVKILIFRQPYFRPDTAMAQKLWDHWDDQLDRKYSLPKPSPRKNIKRLENLVTMCVQNAVGHVFMYRQTACKYDAGKVTEEYPHGKPFDIRMLWECVQLLQPTREMIHQAWSMGLEYNIGTSCMGLNTMTIIAEITGRKVGDWFSKPVTGNFRQYLKTDAQLRELEQELDIVKTKRRNKKNNGDDDDDDEPNPLEQRRIVQSLYGQGSVDKGEDFLGDEWPRLFQKDSDVLTKADAEKLRLQLRSTREARSEYRYVCSRTELQNQPMRDAAQIIDDAIGEEIGRMVLDDLPGVDAMEGVVDASMPHNERSGGNGQAEDEDEDFFNSEEDDLTDQQIGKRFWKQGQVECDDEDLLDNNEVVIEAYHRARARDMPGGANCCIEHPPEPYYQLMCPYCTTDLEGPALVQAQRIAKGLTAEPEESEAEEEVVVPTHLSLASSRAFPTLLEAGMFYKPQTVVQFCAGDGAFIDPSGNNALGTRPFGSSFRYKPKRNGGGGAARVDVAWLQADGEQFRTWHKIACYVKERSGSRTCAEYDFHTDGLRDCMYLCSTRDNARRIPEEPYLPSDKTPEKNLQTLEGGVLTSTDWVVKTQQHRFKGLDTRTAPAGHMHLPRDTRSGVSTCDLQRAMDSLYHGGRLCALNVLTSNHVVSAPPIRLHQDGLEVNVGGLHDHMGLIAESSLVCANIPGLHNMQETFCNNQPGPDGLSAPPKPQKNAKSGDKRAADETPKDRDSEDNFMMPYSYDVAGTAISWDMMSMFYDDMCEKRVTGTNARYEKAYGMQLSTEGLPHLSMRYIGYENTNRQTLSMKISTVASQPYVEAGDPDVAKADISLDHVERSLCRAATSLDVVKYISRRQGARSMKGVTGDLFASSTWLKHTLATLEDRGLIKGLPTEPAVKALSDMEHCIQARILEYGCTKNMGPSKGMNLHKAKPNTYVAKAKQRKGLASGNSADKPRAPKVRCDVHRAAFDIFDAVAFDDDDGLNVNLNRPGRSSDMECDDAEGEDDEDVGHEDDVHRAGAQLGLGSGPIPMQ